MTGVKQPTELCRVKSSNDKLVVELERILNQLTTMNIGGCASQNAGERDQAMIVNIIWQKKIKDLTQLGATVCSI